MIAELVSEWERVDVGGLDAEAVRRGLREVAQVVNWAVAVRARLGQRLDVLADEALQPTVGRDPAPSPPRPVEIELVEAGRVSDREAERQAAQARLLARFPSFAAGLEGSMVAVSHVEVLARLWNQLAEADRERMVGLDSRMVLWARHADPQRFRRVLAGAVNRLRGDDGLGRLVKQRRATRLGMWVDVEGMVNLRGRFDPERGLRLRERVRAHRELLFPAGGPVPVDCPEGEARWEHLDAVALLDLVDAAGTHASRPGTFGNPDSRAEVVVTIDYHGLRGGVHAASRIDAGGVALPVETIRRMACTAQLIPVVLDGAGVVLDEGRRKRLASHEQRIALRAMYDSCAVPGCEVRFACCQPHHLDPWEPDGATDLHRLLPLCSRHHHFAHEGGWRLALERVGRRLTITRPDGGVIVHYPDTRPDHDADLSYASDTCGTTDGEGADLSYASDTCSTANGDGADLSNASDTCSTADTPDRSGGKESDLAA